MFATVLYSIESDGEPCLARSTVSGIPTVSIFSNFSYPRKNLLKMLAHLVNGFSFVLPIFNFVLDFHAS